MPATTTTTHPPSSSDVTPKYAQVREAVQELLEGQPAGTALPPERSLCERFGVSRVTLRRAVDDLVRDGLLVRRQGSGTYVAAPKITQPLSTTSFSEDMRRRGLEPSSELLSFEHRTAGPRTARRLGISPSASVAELVRLRLADGEPMAIETVVLPAELVPDLDPGELAGRSLYEVLDERYSLRVVDVHQVIEPTVTSEEESGTLGVALHSPALLVRTTGRDATGRTVEVARSLFRGDRYAIVAHVRAGADGRSGVALSGVVTSDLA